MMAVRIANVESISGLIGSGAARPVRFGAVGAVTFGVQLGLFGLFKALGMGAIFGYALALALSVQFNFVVNQLFVWHDRPLAMFSAQGAQRWVTFHGCIALSLVVNFLAFVIAREFMADLPAAVIGVGSSTALKFLSLDKLAFKSAEETV
jgi:putative flippase GtrA